MPFAKIERRKRNEWLTGYLFVLPNVLGLTLFVFVPIVYAFYVSLHDWNLLSPKVFVGLQNYVKLLSDGAWWRSLGRTLLYSALYVPLLFCSALLAAVLINNIGGRLKNVVQTMYLMPFAITSIIAAVIWMFMLDPRTGFVNQLLSLVGLPHQQFLGSTDQALVCIVIVMLWMNLGYNMMIFLSAIKEIPADYFEAARIDGASKWQIFWHITFPLLREVSIFIFIVTMIASLQVFDQIQVMTKGGPANATEVSVLYIYKQAFQLLNMGYSSAMAFVLFVLIFLLSTFFLRVFSNKEKGEMR